MRRLLLTLLLAHVVASYCLAVALTLHLTVPPAETWLLVTVESPLILGTVTTRALGGGMPWKIVAVAYAGYGLGFAGTIAARALEGRQSRKTRRRRQGLCTECGYDLTGNVSGKCPECGVHVNPRARLIVRRGQ
jgi:hypothetical protein